MLGRRTRLLAGVAAASVLAALPALALIGSDDEPGRMPARAAERAPAATPVASAGDAQQAGRPTTLVVARGIAKRFDLEITSGYRTPLHNAEVGGAEGSYHTRGTVANPGAVDLLGSAADMRAALAWAREHVPNLAEGMVHAVCLVDGDRPWRVGDGGLHLHLAFASTAVAKEGPFISVAMRSGCQTAASRLRAALGAIAAKRTADVYTAGEAARARIRAARRALDGDYGRLGERGRSFAALTRRNASATIDKVLAARATPKPEYAFDRYERAASDIEARERTGELSASQATALQIELATATLAGRYGGLNRIERAVVVERREDLHGTTDPATTTTTTTPSATPTPTTTTTTPTTTTTTSPVPPAATSPAAAVESPATP